MENLVDIQTKLKDTLKPFDGKTPESIGSNFRRDYLIDTVLTLRDYVGKLNAFVNSYKSEIDQLNAYIDGVRNGAAQAKAIEEKFESFVKVILPAAISSAVQANKRISPIEKVPQDAEKHVVFIEPSSGKFDRST